MLLLLHQLLQACGCPPAGKSQCRGFGLLRQRLSAACRVHRLLVFTVCTSPVSVRQGWFLTTIKGWKLLLTLCFADAHMVCHSPMAAAWILICPTAAAAVPAHQRACGQLHMESTG